MLILIAEDDELILKTVEHKLLKEGYEVVVTRNGKDAIDTIKEREIDLIITDIMMPFASGTEILAAVRSFGKKIPVIMLSSLGQESGVGSFRFRSFRFYGKTF
jgi:DNA-binding response OmpR family regulator